jgi:hypothetical protein
MIKLLLRSYKWVSRVLGRAQTAAPPTFAEYIASLRNAGTR